MLDIYNYTDYRNYLSDFYKHQKANVRNFSFRSFSHKAGLKSPNYLHLVITGQRNITLNNLPNFIKGLGIKGDEAKYFENLVKIDYHSDFVEKAKYYEELFKLYSKKKATEIQQHQYKVLSRWYYLVIRELVLLSDFQNDPKWISDKLNKAISETEAQEAIDTLIKLDLLRYKNGRLIQTNRNITTSDEISNLAIRQFHGSMIKKSINALANQPVDKREMNALTIAISKDKINEIKNKIKAFRKELNESLINDENQEDVYQLNIQFFNLT